MKNTLAICFMLSSISAMSDQQKSGISFTRYVSEAPSIVQVIVQGDSASMIYNRLTAEEVILMSYADMTVKEKNAKHINCMKTESKSGVDYTCRSIMNNSGEALLFTIIGE